MIQQGESYCDIAKQFDIPIGTLHNKVHRRHGKDCGSPSLVM